MLICDRALRVASCQLPARQCRHIQTQPATQQQAQLGQAAGGGLHFRTPPLGQQLPGLRTCQTQGFQQVIDRLGRRRSQCFLISDYRQASSLLPPNPAWAPTRRPSRPAGQLTSRSDPSAPGLLPRSGPKALTGKAPAFYPSRDPHAVYANYPNSPTLGAPSLSASCAARA